jgi:hypothetical protein
MSVPSSADGSALAVTMPYYRRYDLPWSPSEEMERRFRLILRSLAVVFLVLAVVIPFLPHEAQVTNTDSLPERVVQLVMEPPPPPPPPPPKEKPLEKAPVAATPTPPRPVDPRVKASKSGLLANLDDLAALRNQVDVDKFAKDQAKTVDPGDVSSVNRSLITSKAGGTSGGQRFLERHPHDPGPRPHGRRRRARRDPFGWQRQVIAHRRGGRSGVRQEQGGHLRPVPARAPRQSGHAGQGRRRTDDLTVG